jgi:hypothetical protein
MESVNINKAVSVDFTKFNQNHGEDGRFSEGPGVGIVSGKLTKRLRKPDGGFTIDANGKEPTTGFAVSVHEDRAASLGDVRRITQPKLTRAVADFQSRNADLLSQKGNHVGAWHDPVTHQGYLDVATITDTAEEAHALGAAHDQIAYFDIAGGKSVDIDRNAHSGFAM